MFLWHVARGPSVFGGLSHFLHRWRGASPLQNAREIENRLNGFELNCTIGKLLDLHFVASSKLPPPAVGHRNRYLSFTADRRLIHDIHFTIMKCKVK